MSNPFRYFNSSPEVIRLVVMMYVRYPLSLRNVEDLLAGRGIDISHETVRFWWNRFGPMFAAEIRKRRVAHVRAYPQWRWHLDEVFVKVNGKLCYLWRAVDHEGEVLEAVVTARRDKAAALELLKRIMKKYGAPRSIVTDRLRDELLDGEIFYSLAEAEIVIESWRRHYNTVRPHGSLGYKPPAPEVFVPAIAARAAAQPRPAPPPALAQSTFLN